MKASDLTKWILFRLTSITTVAGYRKLVMDVTASSDASPFSNGDTIFLHFSATGDAGIDGSGAGSTLDVNQTAHGLVAGDVVRLSGTDYIKAQADTEANAEVVGIVLSVFDADNFTVQAGGYTDGLSGLTAGVVYYLSEATAGLLTTTEPTGVGEVSKPVLISSTTTSGWLFNMRGFIIAAASSDTVNADDLSLIIHMEVFA